MSHFAARVWYRYLWRAVESIGNTAGVIDTAPIPEGSPEQVPLIRLASITLRPITADDIDFVEASCLDPYVCQISTMPNPFTIAEGHAFINRQHGRVAEGAGYPFVIEPHTPVGPIRAVGFIGVWFRQRLEHGHLTFGYSTIKAARGLGLMSQALRGVSDWAFGSFDCNRHRLWIEAWNIASQRTGERAGFAHQTGVRALEDLHGVDTEVLAWDRARPQPGVERSSR